MARNEERRRVRERLGALAVEPAGARAMPGGTRAVPGGRWDLEELEPGERESGGPEAGEDRADRWDEPVEGPRTPQWLSEPSGALSLWHERLVPERFRGTRLDPGRRGVLVLAAVGLVAVLLAAAAMQRERPVAQPVPPLPAVRTSVVPSSAAAAPAVPTGAAAGSVPAAPASDRSADLVVSVVGLIEHPGLLHLPPGSRVADALAVAVAEDGADLASLNLAQRLADGDQIVVGAPGPQSGPPQMGSVVVPGGRAAATGGTSGAGAHSGPAAKIDLNTAAESELDALPGVGPATARAIVAWRTEHGRFTSVDQLAEVTGIGPARLTRLRDLVTV